MALKDQEYPLFLQAFQDSAAVRENHGGDAALKFKGKTLECRIYLMILTEMQTRVMNLSRRDFLGLAAKKESQGGDAARILDDNVLECQRCRTALMTKV